MTRRIDDDAVKRRIWNIVEKWKYQGRKYDALLLESVIAQIVDTHPTLTTPTEWVSVKDAVPDPGERVLATDGIFVGEAYRSSANSWFRHTGFPWMDGVTGRTVRFWMPMPSSPDRRPPEGEI